MVELMHPNKLTILLVVDLCSSLAYFMMTQPLPIAGKLPIKTLVAKQLPTNTHAYTYTQHAHNGYLTVIGVHEMHAWSNAPQTTILLVVQ